MLGTFIRDIFGEPTASIHGETRVFCPFHNDKNNPNLDINEAKKTYLCRACGARGVFCIDKGYIMHRTSDVVPWQRIDLHDWPWILSSTISVQKAEKTKHAPMVDLHQTASYEYTDEHGKILFYVRRFEDGLGKKTFRQFAADGTPSIAGIPNVPLFFPEIIKNKDSDIYIVEGEKCAIFLHEKTGVLATTYSGGSQFAGNKREIVVAPFIKRSVIAIPDNDLPGRKWTESIIETIGPVAENLFICSQNLMGFPEHHDDVVDWLMLNDVSMFNKIIQITKLSPWRKYEQKRSVGDGN